MIDITTSALAVFERVVPKALRDDKIDEEEFNSLHTLYHETLNELSDIYRKMEAGIRNQIEKCLLEPGANRYHYSFWSMCVSKTWLFVS